ncbi:hypothetical protein BP6252_04990 [Coleophoma cylindrospora]|uniref:NAD(P)-binding protein n=1 Tax=Coleophoma cylindrospora TaxID=1849047 RepID=A0A3D8RS84_9HELO|nr:hypothetical protein BP6252_04990 [Coleophoma cylindrospora]
MHPGPDALSPTAHVWLVTGCSSGLGRMLVPAILARGDKVIATARRLSDLDYIQGLEGAKALQLDLTDSDEIHREKANEAIRAFGQVDVVVNNAGYVHSGVWEEVSHEDTLRQFDTNFFGALKVTRSLLPHMRSRKSGVVLYMSSIAGWVGVGAGGPYSSSKFALEGAVECLQKETSHLGIRTHLLVLGQFRTGILSTEKTVGQLRPSTIEDYDIVKQELADRHAATNGLQPGKPEAAVERILDIVREENLTGAQRGNLPLRIPIGSDAVEVMKRKCVETLQVLEDWGEFASSTDYAGKQATSLKYGQS